MKCPRCDSQELTTRVIPGKGAEVDICPNCRGVWFDKGELLRVIPEAEKELTVPDRAERGQGECPKCWTTMRRFPYPGTFVQIDVCHRCSGLWLDGGEFKELRLVRKVRKRDNESKGLLGFIQSVIDALRSDG